MLCFVPVLHGRVWYVCCYVRKKALVVVVVVVCHDQVRLQVSQGFRCRDS